MIVAKQMQESVQEEMEDLVVKIRTARQCLPFRLVQIDDNIAQGDGDPLGSCQ